MRVKMPSGFVVYNFIWVAVNNTVSRGDTIHYSGTVVNYSRWTIFPPTPVANNNHAHAPH